MVDFLLSHGAGVNARGPAGSTPLQDAALGGHAVVAALLLDKGADLNARDAESGSTALHIAASYGRRDVVLLLLDRGADRRIRNKAGKTPYDLAIEAGQKDLAAMLH